MLGALTRQTWGFWAITLGNDTTTFLGVDLWLHGVKSDFAPALDTDFSLAEESDFDGYPSPADRKIDAAARTFGYDGATGDMQIMLPAPTGGNFMTTTGVTNLPQVLYGFALSTDSVGLNTANIVASLRLDAPIDVTINAQLIPLPDLGLRVSPNDPSGL